jgi:hypothetical protein
MFEIEVFSSFNRSDLKDQLNSFLNKLNMDEELYDVKFSSSVAASSSGELYEMFSAMVIVKKPKGAEEDQSK